MFQCAISGPFVSRLGIPSLSSAALNVVNVGLSLGVSVLLARILGADGLGVYAGAMALVSLLAVPAGLGVPFGLVQLISRYLAAGDLTHARGSIRWGYAQVLGAGLLLAGLCAIGTVSLFSGKGETIAVYLLAFAVLPVLCLTSVQRGILHAFERITLSQVPQVLVRPGVLAVLLLAWIIFGTGTEGGPATAMTMQVSAHVVTLLAGAILLWSFGPRTLPHGARAYDYRRWYGVTLPFVAAGAADIVLAQTDLIMLSVLEPPASVGYYRVATAVSGLVTLPFMAVQLPLAPAIARAYERRARSELQRMLTVTARWAFAGCLPIVLVLALAGDWLLGFVYGMKFVAAYPVLVVLTLVRGIIIVVGPVGLILLMTGHQRDVARAALVAAVCNLMLNAALIPAFGGLGAAIATGVSLVLSSILLLRSVIRKLKLDPTIFGRTKK